MPAGFRIRLDPRLHLSVDASVLIGGSPWRISKIKGAARDLVRRLRVAGTTGMAMNLALDRSLARELIDRGFAHPAHRQKPKSSPECTIVVPALDQPENLAHLLSSLGEQEVLVVDDGSACPEPLVAAADRHGARITHHSINSGPAAARNTGLAHSTSPFVAFIDSDCIADPTWPGSLLSHFEDPAVAVVAPRIVPTRGRWSLLERYDMARSSLDMGRRPELVKPGAPLSFVPSAAIVVRRSALSASAFDPNLRLGEDVDLIWRLAEAGWLIRFDPSVTVRHRTRSNPRAWLQRRYEYGTSAIGLEKRHPGNLTPARVSGWNLGALILAGGGHPLLASAALTTSGIMLHRRIRGLPQAPVIAARTLGKSVSADATSIGRLLRREWWPVGASALALSPRSRIARTAALCMIAPLAWEWLTDRPSIDPVRYTALRLIDDAAYGSGVIAGSFRGRSASPLTPTLRLAQKSPT